MQSDHQGRVGAKNRRDTRHAVMRVNYIVLCAAGPLANLKCGFEVFDLRAVSLKVQNIDLVFHGPELLDLLHHKGAGALISRMRIHGRDHQNFQTHTLWTTRSASFGSASANDDFPLSHQMGPGSRVRAIVSWYMRIVFAAN